ncbi:hypothetical protein [Piscinibacter defluvii]|uniref:hypothetical protein n=1 Tax=Piscinibacter defluvii TaxID=1796922 RepID=UPI000FDF2502|nr:hypothetical protein [Piscinibacter defluvii]
MSLPVRSALFVLLAFLALQARGVEFATDSYRLTLPGAWRDVSAPDVITYESASGEEEVVVGEYKLKGALGGQELRSLLEEFVEMRRSTEAQLFHGRAFIGRAFYSTSANYIQAEYWGDHAQSGQQFVTVVYATSARLLSFRYESRKRSTEFRTAAESECCLEFAFYRRSADA